MNWAVFKDLFKLFKQWINSESVNDLNISQMICKIIISKVFFAGLLSPVNSWYYDYYAILLRLRLSLIITHLQRAAHIRSPSVIMQHLLRRAHAVENEERII